MSRTAPRPARPAVVFILITVVLDSMGIGLILPVMPELLVEVGGGSLASAAIWGGALSTGFAVMQFLFGPTVGNLSDRFGRRPVLLIALAVMTLDYLVMAVANALWMILVLRLLNGMTAATHSTASAYMADISAAEQKSARFGLIGAAFGIGFVLGPLVGGLVATLGTRAPFCAAAGFAALNLAFGALVLPETVTDRIRRRFDWRRANPFGAFRVIGRLAGMRPLMLLFFLNQVAFFVYPAIWAYYTTAAFGWSAAMIGTSLALFGVTMAVAQGALIRPILRRLGEMPTVMLGLSCDIAAFLVMAVATSGTLVLALAPVAALGGVVTPAIQGMMSKSARDDQQGELQGVLGSIAAMASILSPFLMTSTFAAFTAPGAALHLPGAPFLLAACLTLVCLGLAAAIRRHPVAG